MDGKGEAVVMYSLDRIELQNWMPFGGDHALDLPEGPIAVVARYAENERRSNWAGKTAFLEAIEWCLFGVHRKRYEDGVIHNGTEVTRVKLTIGGNVAPITIERSRARGKTTQVEVVDVDGVVHKQGAAQEAIDRIVGLDAADYRATLCFAQGDTEAIVERTSGERRKIVGQWLELDPWFRVAAYARAHATKTAADAKAIATEIDRGTKALEAADLPAVQDQIKEAARQWNEKKTVTKAAQEALDAAIKAQAPRQAVVRLRVVADEGKALRAELEAGPPEGVQEAQAARQEAVTAETVAEAEVRKVRALAGGSGFDGTCPVTCEVCPVSDTVRENRTAVDKRLREAEAVQKVAREKAVLARDAARLKEEALREFDRKRQRFNGLVEEAKRLKVDAASAASAPTDEQVAELRAARDEAQRIEREVHDKAVGVRVQGENLVKEFDRVEKLKVELKGAQHAAQVAAIALRCVGPAGVPAQIIAASLATLEQRTAGLLAGTGLNISFDLDRPTRDPEPVCSDCGYTYKGKKDKNCPACNVERPLKRSDELEILVDDGSGEVEDVKAKSGGAKALIASAIRLSAATMLRELRGAQCAWAIIDEPFGALDSENREMLVRVFGGMLGAVGLAQAFVVSHDIALLDSLPNRIEILRSDSESQIRVV